MPSMLGARPPAYPAWRAPAPRPVAHHPQQRRPAEAADLGRGEQQARPQAQVARADAGLLHQQQHHQGQDRRARHRDHPGRRQQRSGAQHHHAGQAECRCQQQHRQGHAPGAGARKTRYDEGGQQPAQRADGGPSAGGGQVEAGFFQVGRLPRVQSVVHYEGAQRQHQQQAHVALAQQHQPPPAHPRRRRRPRSHTVGRGRIAVVEGPQQQRAAAGYREHEHHQAPRPEQAQQDAGGGGQHDNGADGRGGGVEARGASALPRREPLGHDLGDADRHHRPADAEQRHRGQQRPERGCRGAQHQRQDDRHQRQGHRAAHPEPVDRDAEGNGGEHVHQLPDAEYQPHAGTGQAQVAHDRRHQGRKRPGGETERAVRQPAQRQHPPLHGNHGCSP